MSDNQTAWTVLWNQAANGPKPGEPFEIDEAVPAVMKALSIPENQARKLISGLLVELERMPEGQRYFRREGNAVVPLDEFLRVPKTPGAALNTYPYEL